MSQNDAAESDVLETGDERLLLCVAGDRDRDLLADRLADRYEIHAGDPADVPEFDLCVVDAARYRQVEDTLAELKRASDAYLPVLLLVEDRDRPGQAAWLEETVGGTVDDVLVIPSPPHELDARVEALMQTRRQSQELALYRRAMDEATIGISITDPSRPDNPLVYVNDGFRRLTGYDPETVLGRNCRFLQGPDTDEATVEKLRSAIDAEEPVSVEIRNYRADGEPFWNRLTIAPVTDDAGQVTHYLGFQQDVTDRVERERRLERASLVLETMDDGVWTLDGDMRLSFVNATIVEYLPFDEADLLGTPLENFAYLFEDEAEFHRYRDAIEDLLAGRRDEATVDATLSMPDETIVTNLRLAPITSEDGVEGVVVVSSDITDRVKLEEELRSERELLERIFDTSPAGIVVIDGTGDITRANPAAEAELGLERSEITGRTFDDPEWEAFDEHGDPVPNEELPAARVFRTGEPVEDYRHGIRVDGEERWLSINAAPLTDDDGVVESVVAGVTDITERLERKRELERYEAIVETTSDPIYVLDPEGHFIRVNDAMVEASGYSREELLGSHASLVADAETVATAERHIRDLLRGDRDEAQFEGTMVFRDGVRREFAASISVLTDDDGTFNGSVVVAHDITDLLRSQRRLSVLDRVLRHNLRNRINVVLGNARELADHPDDDVASLGAGIADSAEDLLELSESARKFEAIITGSPDATTVDAVDVVTTVVDEAADDHPDADLSVDLPDTAPIRAHETFRLAVDELLENAIEHNDTGAPSVTVTVRNAADGVEIRVADDGPGISELDRRALDARAESPLEHTQGIGLWLVQWTIDNVGGDLEIEDNEPRGTVVTITVPPASG